MWDLEPGTEVDRDISTLYYVCEEGIRAKTSFETLKAARSYKKQLQDKGIHAWIMRYRTEATIITTVEYAS